MFLDSLTPSELVSLPYDWPFWARGKQLPPPGNWRYWLIMAGRGFGKALAIDTPIPTISGWSTMGDLQEGNIIFDEQGKPAKVTFATPVMHGRKCYDVVFSDGSIITADADHLWLTWDKSARKSAGRRTNKPSNKPQCQARCFPSVRTTEEIKASLIYKEHEINHSVSTCAPLELNDYALPIKPYTLGAWLGDGDSNGSGFTYSEDDQEIIQHIKSDGYASNVWAVIRGKTRRCTIGVVGSTRNPKTGRMEANDSLISWLKRTDLIGNKHIPGIYLRSSYETRLALLQGLMDTGGSITPGGTCEFTATNKRLAEGVYELVMTLGIKATLIIGRATLNGVDCGPKYRVYFTPYIPVFRLSRKVAYVKEPGKQSTRQAMRYIVEIKERESVPVRCIQVDSPSHLFLAGRSFIPTHNTRTGAEWVREQVKHYPYVNLIGATTDDAREIMIEGESGLLAICPPGERPRYIANKRRLEWPNGARSLVFTADAPERLRGKQHMKLWADELAAWRYAEAWDQAMLGLRLGDNPQACITTTPRPTRVIKELVAHPKCVVVTGTTYENRANLAEGFYDDIITKYEGTHLGEQELLAKLIDEVPGALWTRGILENNRVHHYPDLARIVVAIDPAATSNADSNETGIVVAGIDEHRQGYVIDCAHGRFTPDEWATQAIRLYKSYDADRIIAEVNNGGEMVEKTLRTVSERVAYTAIHASRGKHTRAEPVAALYEQGKVHHVGLFAEMEDQMCTWLPGETSPDLLDAAVWAITELMLDPPRSSARRLQAEGLYPSQSTGNGQRPRGRGARAKVTPRS